MSKRTKGEVELFLGSTTGKRKRQSLIGAVVVEDYNSNRLGGRVVVVQMPAKAGGTSRAVTPRAPRKPILRPPTPTPVVVVAEPEVSDGA